MANYWDNYWRQKFNRRRVLAATGTAAVGGASLALVGCGGGSDSSSTATQGGVDSGVKGQPTASSDKPVKGGTIKYAHTADADHMDPALETTWLMNIGPHVYSKLLRWDSKVQNILPDLSPAVPEQPDSQTYTFKLRPGLKFSDGSPLTSADVKYTYQRIAAKETASPHQYKVGPLDSITTPDDSTVTFKLSKPFAPFVSFAATGWMMILSQKFVEAKGPKFQDVLGSGPYMIESRQKAVATKFKRNPNYYNPDLPYPDAMDFRIIPDAATMQAAFIANELDFLLSSTDASVIQSITSANKDAINMEHAAHHWNMFIMNCSSSNLIFKDKRMRQAMNLLIDRELYQKIVHSTGGKASGPVTWGFTKYAIPQDQLLARPGYRKDKTQDIKDAKALMAAAGFPNGVKVKCATVTAAAHATYNAGALALKDQLAQYGVEFDLGVTDMAGIQAKRSSGDFDCMVYVNGGSQEIDEHIYGPNYTGQARNVNKYSNPDVDALLDKQRVTIDEAERKKIIMDVQEKLLEDVPTAWLADPVYHTLTNKRLVGLQPPLVFDYSSLLVEASIKA